jgi:hypothetical protein
MLRGGLGLALIVLGAPLCAAQDGDIPDSAATDDNISLFLDCRRCDRDHIRREITFIDYVRDRRDAQVHLLVTTQRAGGGREYNLNFIGQQSFLGVNDTLVFVASRTDTSDEVRSTLVQNIKLGLMRYVARTDLRDDIEIGLKRVRPPRRPDEDPWDFWVFSISGNGSYFEEASTSNLSARAWASADRITEEWKLRFAAFGSYRESNFEFEDEDLKSTWTDGNIRGQVIKSIGSNWGAGLFGRASTSSFRNTDFSARLSPAIEYSIFPYSESTRRELRLTYYLNFVSNQYNEETVFGKTDDFLLSHELQLTLDVTQPWGSAQVSLEGSSYIFDFQTGETLTDLYRIDLYGYLDVRLFRVLNVFGDVAISRVEDQIFLPASEASPEDILLGNIQLPTDFSFNVSLGLRYTFGSIYSNVVNSRFGS